MNLIEAECDQNTFKLIAYSNAQRIQVQPGVLRSANSKYLYQKIRFTRYTRLLKASVIMVLLNVDMDQIAVSGINRMGYEHPKK